MSSGFENVCPSTWAPWASRVVRGWTEGGPVDNLPWPPGRPRPGRCISWCTLGARYRCSGTPTLLDFQSRLCIHRIHWMASNANIAFIVYFLLFVFLSCTRGERRQRAAGQVRRARGKRHRAHVEQQLQQSATSRNRRRSFQRSLQLEKLVKVKVKQAPTKHKSGPPAPNKK